VLKLLNVVDEHTREALAMVAARSITADATVATLDQSAPWENPYVESFNGRLRDELLAVEQFDTLLQAQVLIEDWRIEYNTRRPHSSLRWLAPAAYAERWRAEQLAGLS
jgi:transposase InsO family protein